MFFLCIRYSSDDTDDDSSANIVKKKKNTSSLRRQTLANPMPPPSTPPDAINVTKNLIKDNPLPLHSEFKDPNVADFDNSSVSSSTRTISKTQNKFVKTQRTYVSDGLETGSDSDVAEDSGNIYARAKYLSNLSPTNRLYDSRMHDRTVLDHDQTSKTGSGHVMKDKYNVKPNVSTIQSTKENASGKDNTRDLLANYETPFLSEFTRRLSSRSLHTIASPTLPSLKSKCII